MNSKIILSKKFERDPEARMTFPLSVNVAGFDDEGNEIIMIFSSSSVSSTYEFSIQDSQKLIDSLKDVIDEIRKVRYVNECKKLAEEKHKLEITKEE